MFEEEGSFKIARDAVISGKPYPVKGFVSYKTNPMGTGGQPQKDGQDGRRPMDFWMHMDIAMSDTAWMADLVLPSQCAMERIDPCSAQQGSSACACVVMRDPVVDKSMFASKPVFWMMQELAKRMGLGKHFDFDIETFRTEQLAELPGAMKALKDDGVYYNPSKLYGVYDGRVFKTKTKKIELYNERYKELGVDPLPVYKPPAPIQDGKFRLVVGRNALITQTSSQNNSLLSQFVPTNDLWINPDAAGKLGVADGEAVVVESKVGKQRIRARITDQIRPDTVYMHSGFGVLSKGLSNVYGKGASIAELLEDDMDVISGNMAMHTTMVSVRKGAA